MTHIYGALSGACLMLAGGVMFFGSDYEVVQFALFLSVITGLWSIQEGAKP